MVKKIKRNSGKALRVLLIGNSLILIAGAMLGPIYAIFVKELGGNIADAGITGGILAIASGITSFIIGRITDKTHQGKNILVTGYILTGFVFLSYLLVHTIQALLAVQILNGIIRAISAPVFDMLYARHLIPGKSGSEYGLWNGLWFVANGAGGIIGGIIVASFGFQLVFILMSILCFISACYIIFMPKHLL